MASAQEYLLLISRCRRWDLDDLADLAHEIRRDHDLADDERQHLQQVVSQLIRERAQVDGPPEA